MGIDSDLVLVLVLLSCFMLKLRNRLTDRSSWRTQCRISMYWYSSQQLTTVVRSGFCWFCHSVEGRLSPPHPGPWSFHQEWCDHTPKERTSPSCRDTNVREITRLMFKTCQNFSIILRQPRVHRWGSASCSGYPPGAPRQRYNHAGGIFSTSAAASLWVSGAFSAAWIQSFSISALTNPCLCSLCSLCSPYNHIQAKCLLQLQGHCEGEWSCHDGSWGASPVRKKHLKTVFSERSSNYLTATWALVTFERPPKSR